MVAPLLGGILAYLANPGWMAWASVVVPTWIRWIGVALGVAVVPSVYWVLATFGAHVGQADLTKQQYRLVTMGPYRWVRHPMYAVGFTLALSIGLMAANWFILFWAIVLLVCVRFVVIPREEARLEDMFGDAYRQYRSSTGALLPFPAARGPACRSQT
jgi:protein-S-isoprenylcysteine O-methyltransferase Ste14